MTDLIVAIGETAGKVWRHLAAEGEQELAGLAAQLEEPTERVSLAVGWLAREGKINVRADRGLIRVSIKERNESW